MTTAPIDDTGELKQAASAGTNRNLRAASKKNRVFVFRDFLWETYGHPKIESGSYLKAGDFVLDVAGGKGDLSWLFQNVDGVSSVVVDPRSLSSSNHLIRSVDWLCDHPEEAKIRANPELTSHQPLAALVPEILEQKKIRSERAEAEYLEPRHLKMKLNASVVNAIQKAMEEPVSENGCPPSWSSFWAEIQAENSENASDSGDNLFLPESERKKVAVTAPIQDASEAWTVFRSIRLIVGFHPDQATESICDLAALLRLPVCIVPCCVFPSEFPNRKVAVEGDYGTTKMVKVRDYHLFIQYLHLKYPQLRKETLPFRYIEKSLTGIPLKNVALFTLPEDVQ
jgi:hypothetical protein